MDLRNRIKNLLRMCGHAFVGTVHIRLDSLEHQLSSLHAQNVNIAATQTALLQAAIHSVEVQQQLQAKMQEELDTLKRLLESNASGHAPAHGDR